jgi:hypothetical protein
MADFTVNPGSVSTSTIEKLVAKTVDTILNYSPATLFFLGNQKTWTGNLMRFPIKYQQNTQGIAFDGLQKFSTTKVENFAYMSFSPTGREMPTVISQMEVDVNASNRVIDLIARQMASDAQDQADTIAGKFYTIQTGIEFLSLIDAVDDGTYGAATYGGLNRTTYSLKGNVTTSIGNLTLTNMRTAYNNATHGADSPNIIFTTKACWAYYEKLLTPTLQNQISSTAIAGYPSFVGATMNGLPNILAPGSDLKASQGFKAIYFTGVPVIADEKCPAGYMFGLNTRSLAFYGLKSTAEGYKTVTFMQDESMDSVYNIPTTTGFAWSGFNVPIDQYGKVGHIILMGNLICMNPRLNFLMTGITGS